ncbi:tripartite tricarboxylate transporter TctB family protein [Nocardiopsis sp. NPDC058631]|uniref:tripartite tricarboxylate transporter TctB family protein n=1 Tax=Nocardiopsis sp. NPDC058631 TaxID=3346566 RepID=UPI003647316F
MITSRRGRGESQENQEETAGGAGVSDEAGTGEPVGPGQGEPDTAEEPAPPPAGPVTNLVVALVVVALGAAGLLGSWSLGLGGASSPSAGMWPFLVSAAITCLGAALLLQARRTGDAERFTSSSWLVLGGLATMAAFASLIGVIGFEIPSALLAFVWLRFIGRESWLLSTLTSLGIVVAFYLLFVAVLAVPIPHLF